mmetsp:Transcript_58125/g.138360  ORF Transcript_58125/g.138360 Transcript_58125/m.138360 type:complete len:239 (-) Transcript_58125:150-866(-)
MAISAASTTVGVESSRHSSSAGATTSSITWSSPPRVRKCALSSTVSTAEQLSARTRAVACRVPSVTPHSSACGPGSGAFPHAQSTWTAVWRHALEEEPRASTHAAISPGSSSSISLAFAVAVSCRNCSHLSETREFGSVAHVLAAVSSRCRNSPGGGKDPQDASASRTPSSPSMRSLVEDSRNFRVASSRCHPPPPAGARLPPLDPSIAGRLPTCDVKLLGNHQAVRPGGSAGQPRAG